MRERASLAGKSQNLSTVVQHSFLKTALIPILTVELILLCLYFFSTNYITEKNLNLLRSNAVETVSEISKTEARNFNDQLREISRNNRSLQIEHQALLKTPFTGSHLKMKFSNRQISESPDSPISGVFVSSETELGSEINEKIIKTEEMDVRFKSLVDDNPNLVAAYFISHDNVVRTYPYMDNFYDQFPHNFDLTKYNFYYLADALHNPTLQPVWTDAYLDPAGKGWMLSSLTPIYKNNFLEGVTGLDVTMSTFSKHILSKKLQWRSGALVMDRHGNILTMSRAAESYLGLRDVTDYNFKDNPEDQALTRPTEFNLLKQNTMTGMYFSEFFNGNDKTMEFNIHDEQYFLAKQSIPETDWQLFILAPLKSIYAPILAEKEQITRLGLIFVLLAGVFYALFFIYLKRSSKDLAKRIAAPVNQISKMITSYDSGDKAHAIHDPVNITELDNLLSMNLKIQKAKVRYQKISKEMKIKNEQLRVLSITDQLTQLYNRLKLDEVLAYEVARSQRDNNPLSVAIIDVDKFKTVNDTFGHQVGDSVLIGVAQIMLRNIRATDILGRWGGEEFMLILPNTSLEDAYEHANKLRTLIQAEQFTPVPEITISIGLASCETESCEKMLVELADNALYEAKENGRNRVECAPTKALQPKTTQNSIAVAS